MILIYQNQHIIEFQLIFYSLDQFRFCSLFRPQRFSFHQQFSQIKTASGRQNLIVQIVYEQQRYPNFLTRQTSYKSICLNQHFKLYIQKMNLNFQTQQELNLRFVNSQTIAQQSKPTLNSYAYLEKNNINFSDVFDINQSDNHKSKKNFFSSKQLQALPESKKQMNNYLQDNMGNLKSRRKTIHQMSVHLLKNVQNVLLPSTHRQVIQIFMESEYFLIFLRFIILINMLGIILIDYTFRTEEQHVQSPLTKSNILSLCLQLFCNCVFSLQLGMRIYHQADCLYNPYVIVNLVGTVATWATIFFDMIHNDHYALFRILVMLRIIKAVIRVLQVFEFLKTPFQVFVHTIPSLQKLFFPLIIIMLFSALTGMALFSGAGKYRCVEHSDGHIIIGGYCGSSSYQCPHHFTCEVGEEFQHQSNPENQFNLVSFDNIGNALLTVYHFVFNNNFSEIRSRYTFFIKPYISSIFFISLAVFFFYIFSNLIMISMSKAYMEEIQSKLQKDQVKQEEKEEEQLGLPLRILYIANMAIIIVEAAIISITHSNMNEQTKNLQSLLDFIVAWASLSLVAVILMVERRKYFNNYLNIIDLITLLLHFIDIIRCAVQKHDIIYSQDPFTLILRSLKIVRLIRLLYINNNVFVYEKYVIRVFLKTVYKVKCFMVLCLCFVFMFQQLGELLFAFQVRFDEITPDPIEGVPYANNFETFLSSLFTILFLFFNEQWATTMYFYYQATGLKAIFFFTFAILITHLMLMRLYIAVFLSYFKQELHKQSRKQMFKEKTVGKYNRDIKQLITKNMNLQNSQTISIENQINYKKEEQEGQQQQKSVGLSSSCIRNNCFISILRSFYNSSKFKNLINFAIYIQALTILVRNSQDTAQKNSLLASIQNVCFSLYILQVVFGCLINGIYIGEGSYLRQSKSNVISFLVTLIMCVSLMPLGNKMITNYIRRSMIIKIFTLFRQTGKEMTIILDTIFQISKKLFNFILIYIFFLLIISILPLKFFVDTTNFSICVNATNEEKIPILISDACTAKGGVWVLPEQTFSNIFSAIALMYQLVSTENWTTYLQGLWYKNSNAVWQEFFIVVFFVYNICFLGIFMGFIVETYLHLKDKAYNLNLLKRSQRGWVLIKNSINLLVPKPILTINRYSSISQHFFFGIVTSEIYVSIVDYMAYFNAFLYLITFTSSPEMYSIILNFFKQVFIYLFIINTGLRLYALRMQAFTLQNSTIEFIGSLYFVLYLWVKAFFQLTNEQRHIAQFFLVFFLLLRCKTLLTKYSWCKTHLNAVMDILPKCGNIIKLICSVMFFYVSMGLEIFKYVKHDEVIDNYNIGFNNFLTGLLTLVRVSVSQSWYIVVSAFLKTSSQENHCYNILTYQQGLKYHHQGCGTWIAYPFFLSFHVIMVLLIINLLIATMASAYDDNYQIQYNSVNIFQLQDCLSLWQKYDPEGTGVVSYKKFWRLTSQIAILFGISKKKLIKRKNKFFQELDLPIYQDKHHPILCYRFHDVITKFSKIKLQIANLSHEECENDEVQIQFDISSGVLKEIKDYITPFPDQLYQSYIPFKEYKSGETKYIFGLLKKLRQWKKMSTEKKRIAGGTKLSTIFDLKQARKVDYESVSPEELGMP